MPEVPDPAVKYTDPPRPLAGPDPIYNEPEHPLLAYPEPIFSAPLLPSAADPELRTIVPLTPPTPESAVLNNIAPLLV